MRLLHAGLHLLDGRRSSTGRIDEPPVTPSAPPRPNPTPSGAAAERSAGNGHVDPVAPGQAPDHEHGPNGFDLHALSGNLCRCTGYRPIKDAAYALGAPRRRRPAAGPAATSPRRRRAPTRISSSQGDFVRPADLAEALDLLAENPDAKLVAGSTDWGVELNIRHSRAELTIGIDRLTELRVLDVGDDSIDIGAALTLSEIERGLAGRVPLLAELFPQFASRLIRNGATLGGNLAPARRSGTAHPRCWRWTLAGARVSATASGRCRCPSTSPVTGRPVKRPGRADQGHPDPAAGGADQRLPQDRQAPVRRHLQRGGRFRARLAGRTASVSPTSRSGSAAWRPPRCAPTATEDFLTGKAVDRGRSSRRPPRC